MRGFRPRVPCSPSVGGRPHRTAGHAWQRRSGDARQGGLRRRDDARQQRWAGAWAQWRDPDGRRDSRARTEESPDEEQRAQSQRRKTEGNDGF